MLNKIYVDIKKFFKENYKILLFFVILNIILIIPVPYYVYVDGGISDINDKIVIENSALKKGSLNLAYVDQLNGTVSSFLLSYVMPDWEMEPINNTKLDTEESTKDIDYRNQMLLEIANNNAINVAYQLADKEIKIKAYEFVVLYILDSNDCSLKIGDTILKYDNIKMSDYTTFVNYVNSKNIGDTIIFEVERNNKNIILLVKVKNIGGKKMLGIGIDEIIEYETNPDISLNFEKNESGPSGGLMMTLAIYNKLVEEDITKGLKIVGTGAIDSDGNVESIAGVKYKLKGAVKGHADIFLVPSGDNYQEAIKIKESKNYDIKIIAVESVKDALKKLKAL